jgi:hypothetical protein
MTKNQHELNARASAQMEIDYLRDEIVRLKERAKDVFHARELLKKHGYYVNNLWHIEDVTQVHPMSDEKAYEVLDKVMRGEGTVQCIHETIDIVVDIMELEK